MWRAAVALAIACCCSVAPAVADELPILALDGAGEAEVTAALASPGLVLAIALPSAVDPGIVLEARVRGAGRRQVIERILADDARQLRVALPPGWVQPGIHLVDVSVIGAQGTPLPLLRLRFAVR